tara:strand:- start:1879 stop:3351 length:1473 start_codon:yes stop_codon:yes gene_type:complete
MKKSCLRDIIYLVQNIVFPDVRLILNYANSQNNGQILRIILLQSYILLLGCTLNSRIYDLNPKPVPITLASVSPNQSFFLGGEKITISGTGFREGISVFIEDKECSNLVVLSQESLNCIAPKFDMANLDSSSGATEKQLKAISSKKLSVSIKSPDGTKVNLAEAFQYKSDAFTKVELFSGRLSNAGRSNGIGTQIKFYRPSKAIIHDGYMYVSDTGNQLIRRINMSTLQSEDLAGKCFQRGSTDGIGTNATFNDPMGLVAVGNNLFVVENQSCIVRKIDLTTKQVSLFAGQPDNCSAASDNVVGTNAAFSNLSGITADNNFLYVSDDSSNLRKISLSGTNSVTTVNVDPNVYMTLMDITLMNQALYMTETDNINSYYITKLDLTTGATSTVLGPISVQASGITNDGAYLYVSSSSSDRIAKVDLNSPSLVTLVGTTYGNTDGVGTAARLAAPAGLFYYNNEIYFSSYSSHNIRKFHTGTLEVKTIVGDSK